MAEGTDQSERTLKDLGVRHVEGYYNLYSGRLEEVLLEVQESLVDEGRWWKVNYEVDHGTARVNILPDISDPSELAQLLARTDVAVVKVEGVEEVVVWHEEYAEFYKEMDLDQIEERLPKYHDEPPEEGL